jgi:hypothetical protein
MKILFLSIAESNFSLNTMLCLNDIFVVNNRYKLHSIYKIAYSSQKSKIKNEMLANINLLKTEIADSIKS